MAKGRLTFALLLPSIALELFARDPKVQDAMGGRAVSVTFEARADRALRTYASRFYTRWIKAIKLDRGGPVGAQTLPVATFRQGSELAVAPTPAKRSSTFAIEQQT